MYFLLVFISELLFLNSFLSAVSSQFTAIVYLSISSISDLVCYFKVSIISLISFLSFQYRMLQFSSALCPYFSGVIPGLSRICFIIICFLIMTLY